MDRSNEKWAEYEKSRKKDEEAEKKKRRIFEVAELNEKLETKGEKAKTGTID